AVAARHELFDEIQAQEPPGAGDETVQCRFSRFNANAPVLFFGFSKGPIFLLYQNQSNRISMTTVCPAKRSIAAQARGLNSQELESAAGGPLVNCVAAPIAKK